MVQVAAFTLFALLLARLVGAPRGSWRYVLGAAAAVLVVSQALPEGNAFRQDVAGSARALLWIGLAAAPIAAYAVVLRGLRRRTGVDAPPQAAHPEGLVQFPDDAALSADTGTALVAETEAALSGERVSLGWRAEDGGLAGHLRLRLRGDVAEIEMLRVEPDRRGRGVGAALVRAAELEARARGARRIGLLAGDWQAPEFFAREGYAAGAAHDLGGGRTRRWLEKALT